MRHLLSAATCGVAVLALTGCGTTSLRTTNAGIRSPSTTATSSTTTATAAAAQDLPAGTPAPIPTRITVEDAADVSPPTTPPSVALQTPPAAAPSLLPFATPQAAMRYLTDAYNRNDLASLRKVTTPSTRQALDAMRAEAVNLRLVGCDKQPAGDYLCHFAHDYPASLPPAQRDGTTGHAEFVVGPATKQGWYMTVLESCG